MASRQKIIERDFKHGVERLACGHFVPLKHKVDFWSSVAPMTAYQKYLKAQARLCPKCKAAATAYGESECQT